jgi:glycosyltransferase involved in cell wall biosynthesis
VALVTGSYNYIPDGIALTLNRLVDYLEAHGVEVLVFAPIAKVPAFAHKGSIVPVRSIPLPRRPEYRVALGLPRGARRRMQEFAPDIIHIAVPDLLGYRALKLGRKWRVPVVASYHTRYETYMKHYGLGFLSGALSGYLRAFYNACRELYVPSASMVDRLLADGIKVPVRLWGRGVDITRFNPRKCSQAWRDKHGIGPKDVAVLFVSRLVREKQLDTLAETFRLLRAQDVRHRALIVGDGPERRALERKLPGAAFTGFLDGEELARAYASSDIFFFPSDTESFGSVTLEAMASGLPCVCADATGSRSLVDADVTGFLAQAGDAPALARPIRALALDAELRRKMGLAARERALRFSWDDAMAQLLGYYATLVDAPGTT